VRASHYDPAVNPAEIADIDVVDIVCGASKLAQALAEPVEGRTNTWLRDPLEPPPYAIGQASHRQTPGNVALCYLARRRPDRFLGNLGVR
jgi:hypothetical protein